MRYCYLWSVVYAFYFSRSADLLAAESDFAGHGCDAAGGFFGNAFDCFGDLAAIAGGGVESAFLFHVQVFCVFPHDDEIDGFFRGRDGFDRADVGVEVELLAEGDDGGGVAGHAFGGGGYGAEEGGVTFGAEGLDGAGGEGGAGFLEGGVAGWEVREGEGEGGEGGGEGFEDEAAGLSGLISSLYDLYEGILILRNSTGEF